MPEGSALPLLFTPITLRGISAKNRVVVSPMCRKTYTCAGIWDDKHIPMYRRITDFIKEQGAVPAIQLGHAKGRTAS